MDYEHIFDVLEFTQVFQILRFNFKKMDHALEALKCSKTKNQYYKINITKSILLQI
jgi:hypothetical protein